MRWTRFFVCASVAILSTISGGAATITELRVTHRNGQSFVTFRETGQGGVTYRVFRSTKSITSVQGLTPIAVLDPGSGTNKYTGENFIIEDLGSPLPAGTGLLVYTTASSGGYYYAVTTSSDSSLVPGVNTTSSPVTETRTDDPGAVQIGPTADGPEGLPLTPFFAWEDYSTWDPQWGYYGHRYHVVTQRGMTPGMKYPLTVALHAAGGNGYREPEWIVDSGEEPKSGVYLLPVDLPWLHGLNDPYTGQGRGYSYWFGYARVSTGPFVAENVTERRLIRYISLLQKDSRFQIDPARIYAFGQSLGGGGAMHLADHYPHVFAAATSYVGWVDLQAIGLQDFSGGNPPVNSLTGPLVSDWENAAYVANHSEFVLPPLIHTFRKDDPVIINDTYPNVLEQTERARRAHVSEWRNGGHVGFRIGDHASYLRFRRDEAHPVFAAAVNSTPFDAQEGQRNARLDWSSSLHDLMPGSADALVDTRTAFGITLKSLQGDTTARVTVRNTQQFYLVPGQTVTWSNTSHASGGVIESGTAAADAQGLVSLTLRILAGGNRLTLDCSTCASSAHGRLIKELYLADVTPLPVGRVDHGQKVITLSIPADIDVRDVKVAVTHTGVSVNPSSGHRVDLSKPVTYSVTGGDGSVQTYSVTVIRAGGAGPPAAPTNVRVVR